MSRDEYRAFVRDAERMVQMNTDHAHDFELWRVELQEFWQLNRSERFWNETLTESEFWAQYREEN